MNKDQVTQAYHDNNSISFHAARLMSVIIILCIMKLFVIKRRNSRTPADYHANMHSWASIIKGGGNLDLYMLGMA